MNDFHVRVITVSNELRATFKLSNGDAQEYIYINWFFFVR